MMAEKNERKHPDTSRLKQALIDAMNADIEEILSTAEPLPEPSLKHKIAMNRMFRDQFGCPQLPYPEVEIPDEEQ